MTGTDWAYVPSAPPGGSVLDEIVAAPTADATTDLLAAVGRFLLGLDDRACFAATVDNVVRSGDGTFGVAAPLIDDVTPLDRAASQARIVWHLAWALVHAGALGADAPDRSVDELAVGLSGRMGITVTLDDIERFRGHESATHAALRGFDRDMLERDMRAMGATTARTVAASELLSAAAFARALTTAYTALESARRDRDAAEEAAIGHAASRALARSLGEELERDEWIRARLRMVKATKPAKALIEARKRLLGRD
jgi:hypothetical protein